MEPPGLDPAGVRGIVFDLDGTLIDSYDAIAESLNAARAAHGLGALPMAAIRQRVGRGLETLIEENVGADHVASGVRVFRERYAQAWPRGTTLLPRVAETLAALGARGIALSVASNKPAAFSERILEALGVRPLLAAVEGPDTAGAVKPDPSMIRRCLARMGVSREAAVYVGDMLLDVESAARAQLPVLLVRGGSSDGTALASTGQPVLGTIDEILSWIGPPVPREPS